MEEKDVPKMLLAMSMYRQRCHQELLSCEMFLMHPDTLEDLEQYFIHLYGQSQYFKDISYGPNLIATFQGIPIYSSNDVAEGEVLAINQYNRVFP